MYMLTSIRMLGTQECPAETSRSLEPASFQGTSDGPATFEFDQYARQLISDAVPTTVCTMLFTNGGVRYHATR